MRAASQLLGKGPLMWMMHLHVNQKPHVMMTQFLNTNTEYYSYTDVPTKSDSDVIFVYNC